ncbi:MAG: energy transducer TonB [Bacteroidales bacterium]|jgi:protein TonB|nr:energy transducer TonB [Bacteroidales bacterium]
MEIGLLVALAIVFAAFELTSYPSQVDESVYQMVQTTAIEQDFVPITRRQPPPPPEPPKVVNILDIVTNNTQVSSDISINADPDQDQNQGMENANFAQSGVQITEDEDDALPLQIIEDPPLFNGKSAEMGFREYIARNTNYPPGAAEKGIAGMVIVEFVIEKDGSVSNVRIIRSVYPDLDEEAIRVIKASPKWTPGKQRGKTVKVRFSSQVNFRFR